MLVYPSHRRIMPQNNRLSGSTAAFAEVTRMTSLPQDSRPKNLSLNAASPANSPPAISMDRRRFLAASGGLLAATVPGGSMVGHASESTSSSAHDLTPKP